MGDFQANICHLNEAEEETFQNGREVIFMGIDTSRHIVARAQ